MKTFSLAGIFLLSLGLAFLVQAAEPLEPTEKAFLQSAYKGHSEKLKDLVELGVPVDLTDEKGRTALMLAAYNGHTSIVEFLLAKGADVNAKDKDGQTALFYTSKRSFNETSDFLLKNGIDVNAQSKKRGTTALMIVAVAGNLDMVRTLLLNGADPTLKDRRGYTAETLANRKGNDAVVEQLQNPPEPEGRS